MSDNVKRFIDHTRGGAVIDVDLDTGTVTEVSAPDAIDAILRAIEDEGPSPAHHRAIMRRHREEWPALWRALDKLRASRAPNTEWICALCRRKFSGEPICPNGCVSEDGLYLAIPSPRRTASPHSVAQP